jgi:hypothetical protein
MPHDERRARRAEIRRAIPKVAGAERDAKR